MSAPITEAHRKLRETLEIRWMRATELEIEQLIADSEARACAAVAQWHPASVSPKPSFEGVLCEAYLAITLDAERPCVLTYIYANRQWTQGEGDTQRIKCWGRITPRDWTAERDQLRADCENETKWAAHYLADAQNASARAERAEAEIKDRAAMMRDVMRERDAAEAELANIRALANRRNKQDHSHDTTHQLVASLDQSLDIVQAELVEERWLRGVRNQRSQELLSELASERARLDWLQAQEVNRGLEITKGLDDPLPFLVLGEDGTTHWGNTYRAAIDAAMKEDDK
jgi:hypothetical protein